MIGSPNDEPSPPKQRRGMGDVGRAAADRVCDLDLAERDQAKTQSICFFEATATTTAWRGN